MSSVVDNGKKSIIGIERNSSTKSGDICSTSVELILSKPLSHVYSNEWFGLKLGFKVTDQSLTNTEVQLNASLHLCNSDGIPQNEVDSSSAELNANPENVMSVNLKTALSDSTIPLRFQINSQNYGMYCIKVFASKSRTGLVDVKPISTTPIHLVEYKLSLSARDWDNVWYKDEGGKDKCMQVEICLESKDTTSVHDCRVPLKLSLKYDSPELLQVVNQDLLRIVGPSVVGPFKHFIDPDTGKVMISFRIEDVSKNHQGQDFIVELSSESSKYPHVAPAYTPSVSIRSKRNKRQRPNNSVAQDPQTSQQNPDERINRQFDVSQAAGQIHLHQMSSMHAIAHENQQRPAIDAEEYATIRDAMQGVLRWTEEVVNGLYSLQWEVIGYAALPDGSPDYSHPYHNMPNPNTCITRILSMYADITRDQLAKLMSAVDALEDSSRQNIVNQSRLDQATQGLVSISTAASSLQRQNSSGTQRAPYHNQGQSDGPAT